MQWLDISLPLVKVRQYYLIGAETNQYRQKVCQIVLVEPCHHASEEVRLAIINEIKAKLKSQNGLDEGGTQVILRTNSRRSADENKTKVLVKQLNEVFLETICKTNNFRAYWEDYADY